MAEKTTGFILDPTTGDPISVPTSILTSEQARIMREYKKKVLLPLGLKETLYCQSCWEHNLSHGLEAHVTDNNILLRCRCCMRVYQGPTY